MPFVRDLLRQDVHHPEQRDQHDRDDEDHEQREERRELVFHFRRQQRGACVRWQCKEGEERQQAARAPNGPETSLEKNDVASWALIPCAPGGAPGVPMRTLRMNARNGDILGRNAAASPSCDDALRYSEMAGLTPTFRRNEKEYRPVSETRYTRTSGM